MEKLGRIELIELRDQWVDEAKDFTPWLAQPENLAILGEALGIDLELEAQEKDVGPFHADLLCRDTAMSDSWVVIENQLEKTDHKHLGQLLTYAAGLKANTIVWICSEFTEEHKAVLDWLNQIGGSSARFFGLAIQLWRIGNSPAAPKFNVVCQPNEWEKTVRKAAEGLSDSEERPSEKLRIRYWTAFRSYLQDKKSRLHPQKPGRSHWYTFGIGTSKAHISALLITKEDKIAVELSINSENAKSHFKELLQQKTEIEAIIGEPVEWREMPDKKASRVVLFKSVNSFEESEWPVQFSWLKEKLEGFDEAFRPLFSKMKKTEVE